MGLNDFPDQSECGERFTIPQLIEFLDSLDEHTASVFAVEHAADHYDGTVRSELKILMQELDSENACEDIRYAHSWLSDLWNRADAVSIACGPHATGSVAHRVRDMSVSLIGVVTRIRDEIANGNNDLAEAYRIELIS